MSIMLGKSFSLLFYLKKPKNYVNGAMPIYMRITVDGAPKEISLGRKCDIARWNVNTGRATGTKEEFKKLNEFLDTIQTKVYEARRQLIEKNEAVTAELLKKILLGDHETKCKGILPACIWQAFIMDDDFSNGNISFCIR